MNKKCYVCQKRDIDSKEHVIPKCTGNTGEIEAFCVKNPSNGKLNYEKVFLHDGFWTKSLCKKCNNKFGSKYISNYKSFFDQISNAPTLYDINLNRIISLKKIYPLRIMKQLLIMYLCIQPYPPQDVQKYIIDFVQNAYENWNPKNNQLKIYLYYNKTITGRVSQTLGILDIDKHVSIVISELSWPPLGIVFSFSNSKVFDKLFCINDWLYKRFDEISDCQIYLPELTINDPYPFSYPQIPSFYFNINSLLYLAHIPEESDSITNFPFLLRR